MMAPSRLGDEETASVARPEAFAGPALVGAMPKMAVIRRLASLPPDTSDLWRARLFIVVLAVLSPI